MGHVAVPDLRLDRAVRASAAFPGLIPPARLSIRRLGLSWRHRVHRQPPALRHMAGQPEHRSGRSLHLADGGVSNNLATSETDPTNVGGHIVLVVDASAPPSTRRLLGLAIPYLGEIVALQRSMTVLYANTVEPRMAELDTRGALILARAEADGPFEDFPIVVRVTDNTSDAVRRIRRMRRRAALPELDDDAQSLLETTRRYWNHAARYLRDRYQLKVMAVRSSTVPTTFGKLDRAEAVGLMIHGYLDTMLALSNATHAPHGQLDYDRFERLIEARPAREPAFVTGADRL